MSFFKDPQNNLHFLDDDAFAYLLPEGSVLISDAEAEAIQSADAASAADGAAALIAQAQALLDKSDVTMIRQYEEGNPPPAAWVTYRAALRLVIKGTSTVIPATPAPPA